VKTSNLTPYKPVHIFVWRIGLDDTICSHSSVSVHSTVHSSQAGRGRVEVCLSGSRILLWQYIAGAPSRLYPTPAHGDGLETEITFLGGCGGRRATVTFLSRVWQVGRGCNPPSFTLQPLSNANQYTHDFFSSPCNFISRQQGKKCFAFMRVRKVIFGYEVSLHRERERERLRQLSWTHAVFTPHTVRRCSVLIGSLRVSAGISYFLLVFLPVILSLSIRASGLLTIRINLDL
jgi:hypothetical protein